MTKTLTKKDLKPIERDTPKFRKAKRLGWLTKLPILKQIYRKKHHPRGYDVQAAQIIPMNLQIGDYESEVIPLKLMDHFIDKAGTIVLVQCPCRVTADCQNYNQDLGCVWMGKGAANLDLNNLPGEVEGRVATKEEAKEHVRAALKNGLVPALAKLRGDAVVYNVLDYEDEFMNFCFCCNCCCVSAGMKYGNSDYKKHIKRMKGVTLTVDPEKCDSCGKCFKVCIYNALKLKNGKAEINQENCIGCGLCESICPRGAISLNYDENIDIENVVDEIIERFEKIVAWVTRKGEYEFRHFTFAEADRFVNDVVDAYNTTWASFKEDYIPMNPDDWRESLRKTKPFIDEELSNEICQNNLGKIMEKGIQILITDCPSCTTKWIEGVKERNLALEVISFWDLVVNLKSK